MAELIRPPLIPAAGSGRPTVFLAGGMSWCEDWQAQMARDLRAEAGVLLSPRINKPPYPDREMQAWWEIRGRRQCGATVFYFPDTPKSVQPVTWYEMGANCQSGKPTAVYVDAGHRRRLDIEERIAVNQPAAYIANSLAELTIWTRDYLRNPERVRHSAQVRRLPVRGETHVSVALVGGISDCEDWQAKAASYLRDRGALVANPRDIFKRCDSVETTRKAAVNAANSVWRADAAMVWLPASESLQPIALYELGVLSERKVALVVGIDQNYERADELRLRLRLTRPDVAIYSTLEETVEASGRAVDQLQIGKNDASFNCTFSPRALG